MMQQSPAPRHRRGLLSRVRGWLQRKPNALPPGAAPLLATHEVGNDGAIPPLDSDRRVALKEALQRVGYFAAQVYLAVEFHDQAKIKPNLARRELAAYAVRLVQHGDEPEPRNEHAVLLAFVALHPELDDKPASDWEAFRPNKEIIPPVQLDPATVQRIKFTRFLLQRGTYNEGFEDGEEPPQYHRSIDSFTNEDLRPDK